MYIFIFGKDDYMADDDNDCMANGPSFEDKSKKTSKMKA